MKKSDSLLKLMGMRLNTIAFKIMTDRASIKRFFKSIDQESKYSIRTERNEGEYELPFFYGKKVKELIPEIDKLCDDKYKLIIYKTLDAKDSIMCGAVGRMGDMVTVDYMIGPGTIRDMMKSRPLNITSSPINILQEIGKLPKTERDVLMVIVSNLLTKMRKEDNWIVEWSYYPYNCGVLKQPDVYWEIRDFK